jgi:hypothetical protein
MQGRLSTSDGDASDATFKRRNAFFQNCIGWIRNTRIHMT